MLNTTKTCARPDCDNAIPEGSRSDRIYCSSTCLSIVTKRRARAELKRLRAENERLRAAIADLQGRLAMNS